jgi:transcriptional regulator with XRE-family HTH domain
MAFEVEKSTDGADRGAVLGVADGPRIHQWLQDLLYDKHITQRQIAEDWNVNEAAVSRFIKTGSPRLTTERLEQLAARVGMAPDDVRARLQAAQPGYDEIEAYEASAIVVTGPEGVLDRLRAAVAEARGAGFTVAVTVTMTL